jgi:tetratricopeptide (TPR) repeat protein
MKITRRIPKGLEEFFNYINKTDDLQKSVDIHGFQIYPKDENGRNDYKRRDEIKEIKNEPMYIRWDWSKEESNQWSAFREDYNALYKKTEGNVASPELTKQLEKIINNCQEYDWKQHLLDRVDESRQAPLYQYDTFGIKRDILNYETRFGNIAFRYEEEIPLSDFEKEYVKKNIAIHERAFEIGERIRKTGTDIKTLSLSLLPLWKQLPVLKEEFDKATNTIFMPPPTMKGAMVSEVMSFHIPSLEESQKNTDTFNTHVNIFHVEVHELCNECNRVYNEVVWIETFWDNDKMEYAEPLFDELEKMEREFFNIDKGSIETMSVDDERQEFLGSWSDMWEEGEKVAEEWRDFVDEQKLFMSVYNAFIEFINDSNASRMDKEEESKKPEISGTDNINDTDDMRAETLKRFESDKKFNTNTYFDTMDWHIIIDQYNRGFGGKERMEVIEKALLQHPEDATLLIRKAGFEVDELNYQKAMDLFNLAEKQGPPHHPNFYYMKANLFCKMLSKEKAIPLYRKLAEQKGAEHKWWRINSNDCLIDIYDEKKQYDECIEICKAMIAEEPEKDLHITRLAYFFTKQNQFEKALTVMEEFLKDHPASFNTEKQTGHIYLAINNLEQAIEHYEKAYLTNKGEHYGILFDKGKALIELKRFAEAALCFEF